MTRISSSPPSPSTITINQRPLAAVVMVNSRHCEFQNGLMRRRRGEDRWKKKGLVNGRGVVGGLQTNISLTVGKMTQLEAQRSSYLILS